MDLCSGIADDNDNFRKFYDAFGKHLKLGIHNNTQNRSGCTYLTQKLQLCIAQYLHLNLRFLLLMATLSIP